MAAITVGAMTLGLLSGPSSIASSGEDALNADSVGPRSAAGDLAAGSVRHHEAAAGRHTYLLKLDSVPTARVFKRSRGDGLAFARRAARAQRSRIDDLQADVAADLPGRAEVLYETHALMAGIGVQSTAGAAEAMKDIPGVTAVYPVAPKELDNSYAVDFQGAAAAWSSPGGEAGEGMKIAIVDSGIDYTHSDFGGPGTTTVFEAAQAAEGDPADPGLYPNAKVIGGHDFVGDTYQPDKDEPGYQPNAIPDENPLDCGGHGSHVAGTAAGFGVTSGGATYTGGYGPATDFGAMRIGPGMAPKAQLLAYKVFGCEGSTSWAAAAIDMAADPDGDGDSSDGADVINLSLGSNYGSFEDGDSVIADAAVDLGVSVVASAGNSGDRTDISGAPGNAGKVITVANSQDAESHIDGTEVEIDGISGNYGSSRSFAYDWTENPDLQGTVVRPPNDNLTACSPYPANTFSGQVVMVEWTDDNLECGSVARSTNLAAAGAGGFIFASNRETFAAGITGSSVIPGVIVVASAADQLRSAIIAGQEVEVIGTTTNSVVQSFPADNDKVSQSSSRGIHAAGHLKPDVAAVGATVFSAAVGTGSDGVSESGTSMSSPMVAGLAALVRAAHPSWSPLQVKADIMNTATHDISVNGILGPESDIFSPVRVGAGRIDADQALSSEVLAYNPENGAVSVSFGPVEVDGPTSLTKTVTVENTGSSPVTYDTGYEAATEVPGVGYSISPSQITVAPGDTANVEVTLSANDPADLTKTVDPTIGRLSVATELPRETLSEVAGRLLLDPVASGPVLRVPVYAAPRPVAEMDQTDSVQLTGSQEQTAKVELAGSDLGEGGSNGTGNSDPDDDIFSVAAGFELTAASGKAPLCDQVVTDECVKLPEERGGDLRHVGFTSNQPYAAPGAGRGYFALSTFAPFSVPADKIYFQIDIDVDGDHEGDLFLVNNRLVQASGQDEDVFVSNLRDPDAEDPSIDLRGLNGRFGDLDLAVYDSDTLVLPFSLDALEAYGIDASNPRINYGVSTYSRYSDTFIDSVGYDEQGDLRLSVDLFEPGVTVTDDGGSGPLVEDVDGDSLNVDRDPVSYGMDQGKGLMMVHFHNRNGDKSQIAAFVNPKPDVPVEPGAPPKITASLSSAKGKTRGWYRTPVTISFTCTVGGAPLEADCPGPVTLTGDGRAQSVTRRVTATDGQSATAVVGGIDIDRTRPTVKIKGVRKGKVYRRAPKGRCIARDQLSGVASCKLKKRRKGKKVTYTAKATDKAGNSRTLKVKIRLKR